MIMPHSSLFLAPLLSFSLSCFVSTARVTSSTDTHVHPHASCSPHSHTFVKSSSFKTSCLAFPASVLVDGAQARSVIGSPFRLPISFIKLLRCSTPRLARFESEFSGPVARRPPTTTTMPRLFPSGCPLSRLRQVTHLTFLFILPGSSSPSGRGGLRPPSQSNSSTSSPSSWTRRRCGISVYAARFSARYALSFAVSSALSEMRRPTDCSTPLVQGPRGQLLQAFSGRVGRFLEQL